MESFFERVGVVWPPGRRDLHWHVLPTQEEAAALAAPYREITAPGLHRVPAGGMHCTLLHAVGLGRSDVAVDELLQDVRSAAQTVQPFALTFDRPSVGAMAVEISGWPGAPFAALVDLVTEAMNRTKATFAAAPSRYPHISLGYTGDGADALNAVTLRTAIASIDGPVSGTVLADRIHLVEQWHDGRHITWTPIAEIPLGARA